MHEQDIALFQAELHHLQGQQMTEFCVYELLKLIQNSQQQFRLLDSELGSIGFERVTGLWETFCLQLRKWLKYPLGLQVERTGGNVIVKKMRMTELLVGMSYSWG